MRDSRFLCLAVSRRDGGNCIAGLDIDTGAWVRPVNLRSRGALGDGEIVVLDNQTHQLRIMKPLDLVRLRLGDKVENPSQPENWTLDSTSLAGSSPVLCPACDHPTLLARIRTQAEAGNTLLDLFGTLTNSVPHSVIEQEPPARSLAVIRPRNLRWTRSINYRGNPRMMGIFTFGVENIQYCLPLTDIDWEPKLLEATLKRPTINAEQSLGLNPTHEILLTVSLGDHFRETGNHYKLIAGVLIIPKQ